MEILAGIFAATTIAAIVCLICERKREHRRFTAVLSRLNESVLLFDGKGKLTSYNTAAETLLGRNLKKTSGEILPLSQAVAQALQNRPTEETADIGGKLCRLSAYPMAERGRVHGVILVLFDITEKENRDRLRREFTANVSHELKTPLTSISGFAEILRDGMVKPEDVSQFAGRIHNESKRMITLVEDILELSRLDEPQVTEQREAVDMQQLVRTTVNHLQPLAEKQSVSFDTRTKPLTIYGAPRILEEILYNLCENAVKYNRVGGRVTVTVTEENGQPVLRVADTGIGIPASEQERVFERFYRVDKSHSRAIGGTGLGLSIVKHGVAQHGAVISLNSRVGLGTTVTITFPPQENTVITDWCCGFAFYFLFLGRFLL